MDMAMLKALAAHPYWREVEETAGLYALPVPSTPWQAGFWVRRSWADFVANYAFKDLDGGRLKLLAGIPTEELYELFGLWCAANPSSHVGPYRHAVDFLVPAGTPILAADEGTVEMLRDDNDAWGPSPAFADALNYLNIRHENGEVSQYAHLAQDSARVVIGDTVERGQVLALTGMSGCTDRPHLHFAVHREDPAPQNPILNGSVRFKSLHIRWER